MFFVQRNTAAAAALKHVCLCAPLLQATQLTPTRKSGWRQVSTRSLGSPRLCASGSWVVVVCVCVCGGVGGGGVGGGRHTGFRYCCGGTWWHFHQYVTEAAARADRHGGTGCTAPGCLPCCACQRRLRTCPIVSPCSWSTCNPLLDQHGVPVKFECDADDDAVPYGETPPPPCGASAPPFCRSVEFECHTGDGGTPCGEPPAITRGCRCSAPEASVAAASDHRSRRHDSRLSCLTSA